MQGADLAGIACNAESKKGLEKWAPLQNAFSIACLNTRKVPLHFLMYALALQASTDSYDKGFANSWQLWCGLCKIASLPQHIPWQPQIRGACSCSKRWIAQISVMMPFFTFHAACVAYSKNRSLWILPEVDQFEKLRPVWTWPFICKGCESELKKKLFFAVAVQEETIQLLLHILKEETRTADVTFHCLDAMLVLLTDQTIKAQFCMQEGALPILQALRQYSGNHPLIP